jgi:ATP-dependent DNA helicase RecG
MYYTKDIESFGTGLRRISDACEEAGVRVEFQLLKKGFAVVCYRPGDSFTTTEKMSDVVLNVVLNKSEQIAL